VAIFHFSGLILTKIPVKVAKLTKEKLMEVVNRKMPDLNTKDPEAAARILAGTARQMGIEVEGM
jgi:large subunit ribosomal protein L11